MQETRSLLRQAILKEKLGKQEFHCDMEDVFEPVTAKQAEDTENQKQNQFQIQQQAKNKYKQSKISLKIYLKISNNPAIF